MSCGSQWVALLPPQQHITSSRLGLIGKPLGTQDCLSHSCFFALMLAFVGNHADMQRLERLMFTEKLQLGLQFGFTQERPIKEVGS